MKPLIILTIAGVVMSFWCPIGQADRLYTWEDDNGVTHISKEPPPQKTKLKLHHASRASYKIPLSRLAKLCILQGGQVSTDDLRLTINEWWMSLRSALSKIK